MGQALTDTLLAMAGGGDPIQAYGKAALCGTDCEMEHGSALIHSPRFGNICRVAVGARTYLGFTNLRGPDELVVVSGASSGGRPHHSDRRALSGDQGDGRQRGQSGGGINAADFTREM